MTEGTHSDKAIFKTTMTVTKKEKFPRVICEIGSINSLISVFAVCVILLPVISGQSYGFRPFPPPGPPPPGFSYAFPMGMPGPGPFYQGHPHQFQQRHAFPPQMHISMQSQQPRHFSLPKIRRVTETLGALGTLARHFLTKSTPLIIDATNGGESKTDSSEKGDELEVAETQNQKVSASSGSPVELKPENEEELKKALYTLGRNVLGKNVTDSLVPVVQTVNQMGKFLPPLIYRDGRIILGIGNATKDGGAIKDVVCTTPGGNSGKCLDISGCPSLLLDLQKLRKSICFKALFVPGVCCPDNPEAPNRLTTTSRPYRPTFPVITAGTTQKPSTGGGATLPTYDQCGRAETPSFRIVGGEKSTPGMWPWMAAIFLHGPKGTEFWCGGTLISKRQILTASHCTKDSKQKSFSPRQFTVRLGDYDLLKTDDPSSPESFRVVKITAHSEFNGNGFYNDIALLELERDVEYNRFISPICLPTSRNKYNNFVGTHPTVIGWGTNKYGGREHNALQEVKLPVWSNSECDRAYFQPITDIFLCAGLREGGKDACQGDSGGPLMLDLEGRWVQIGIVSFGNRCAEPGYPGVYTRITQFMDWIQDNAI